MVAQLWALVSTTLLHDSSLQIGYVTAKINKIIFFSTNQPEKVGLGDGKRTYLMDGPILNIWNK